MHFKNTLIVFILFSALQLFGQNDAYHTTLLSKLQTNYGLTGGSWVLTPNENTNASNAISYGHTTSQSTITGQDFTKAIRLSVAGAGNAPWDAGYFIPNVNTVQQGDRVLVVLWLRTISAAQAASGTLTIFAENSTTYHKEVLLNVNPTGQWQQYLIPFESSATYNPAKLNFGFHLAYLQQVLEVGGIALLNYGTSVPFSSLPQKLNLENYPGSDANAPWRTAAESRIEQHRKSNLQLRVEDAQGNPISNASVRVEMLRHKFDFGTAIVSTMLANNSNFDAYYQSKLKDLDGNGHGFNTVVFENALKWNAWEQNWSGTPAETVNTVQWLANNNFRIRGHTLLWGRWEHMPADMLANASNPNYLVNRINGRLATMLNYPGIREYIKEWDVINEIVHERDLEYALKNTTNYTTGREVYAQIFNRTKTEDPAVKTYLNDYNILSFGTTQGGDYLTFKSMLQEIINNGGAVDGVGFQSHMGGALISPDSIYAILEDFHQTFGRDIKITEYDQSNILPDTLAAKYTSDFLKIIYSHPACKGFLTWGMWDGAHWLGNAPFFNLDWSPKPLLATFNDLLFHQWWTDSTLTTNANGDLTIRGFQGDYKITATVNGVEVTANLALDSDLNTTVKMFPVHTHEAISAADIKVFPNPVQSFLNIEMPYDAVWDVMLLDESGRSLFEKTFTGRVQFYNIEHLASGNYFLNIKNEQQEMITKKVMILK